MVNLFAYFFISLIFLIALSAIVTVLISQKIKRSIPKFGKITTLKDAEIHWYETGHGRPIIMLHGLAEFKEFYLCFNRQTKPRLSRYCFR